MAKKSARPKAKQKNYSMNSKKFLSDEEFDHLRRVLERNRASDGRNVALLSVIMHTGCRASEALQIQCDDLNDAKRTVFIRGLKNSLDREIPVPAWLYKMLQTQRDMWRKGRLFRINYQRLSDIWDLYRPASRKSAGLHSLRHTFALRLYIKTRDIRLVQLVLGHRSIDNTLVYVDYVHSTEELVKVLTLDD